MNLFAKNGADKKDNSLESISMPKQELQSGEPPDVLSRLTP
jgi:hypothetical protein